LPSRDIFNWIFQIGISKYLQLCELGRFSLRQSQIGISYLPGSIEN